MHVVVRIHVWSHTLSHFWTFSWKKIIFSHCFHKVLLSLSGATTFSIMTFSKMTLKYIVSKKSCFLSRAPRHSAKWHSAKWHSAKWHSSNNFHPNDIQPNDIQPNDIQPNDIQPNDIQPKSTMGISSFIKSTLAIFENSRTRQLLSRKSHSAVDSFHRTH
jgi:hypothetical protein